MNIREDLYRLFCVPKCPSCDIYLKRGEVVLCSECMSKFEGEKVHKCSFCFQEISRCSCTPKPFKNVKIRHLFKISRYFSGTEDSPTKKLIFSLKKDNLRHTVNFIANELANRLLSHFCENAKELIIVPIPRRRNNVIKFGYDHAYVLAKAIAKKMGCKAMMALKSCSKRDQKGLTREERAENAKYILRPKVQISGKQILILDDIVTTGSSMIAATKFLQKLSPKEINAACFAVSYRDISLNITETF